ncbi:MAG: hypothetical protein J5517_10885 [Eubacterium sp.]|nr:hypothetical protein [Eubacterium sp.]
MKKILGYIIIIATVLIAITGTIFVSMKTGSGMLATMALTAGLSDAAIGYWISNHITGFKKEGFEKKVPMILSLAFALVTFLLGLLSLQIHSGELLGHLGALVLWSGLTIPFLISFVVELIIYFVMKKLIRKDDE